MLPTWGITDEDEKTLLESIEIHNKLVLEGLDCWCEDRRAEIRYLIERLRAERRKIIKKYM
jgi:hypothetical protein